MRNHSASEAYSYYKDAMGALEKLPDSEENTQKQLTIIHRMLIPIYVLGFPEESLSILQAGERIATAMDDKKSLIRFYSSMGTYYAHTGRQMEGRKYSGKAFEEAEKIQEKYYLGKSLIWLGRMTGKADSHKTNEAAQYIQRGIKILSAMQTKPEVSIAHLFLGEIYWRMGLADKAADFLKKAAEMGMDYWLGKTQEILDQL